MLRQIFVTINFSFFLLIAYGNNNNNNSDNNNLHSKIESLQRYIKETPNDPELHLHLGYIYHQLSSKQQSDNDNDNDDNNNDIVTTSNSYSNKAEISYKRCISLNPTNVNCVVNLGKLLYDRYEKNGTLQNENNQQILVNIFHKAMKISPPDHLQSRVNLGINLHNMRRYNEAVEVYKEALPYHKQSIDLLYNYAISLTEIGNISEAMKCYHAAIAIDPTYIKSWLNMGVLHHKHGLLADAVWNYHHAIKALLHQFFSNEEMDDVIDYSIHCTSYRTVYNILDLSTTDEKKSSSALNCDYSNHVFIKLIEDKEKSDDNAIRLLVIILNNLGQAMLQQGRVQDSIQQHFSAAIIIHKIITTKKLSTNQNIQWWNLLLESCVLIFKAAKAGCEWSLWNMIDILVQKINQYQFSNGLEVSKRILTCKHFIFLYSTFFFFLYMHIVIFITI